MSALAPTLQAFFTERLIDQRAASPQTIAAYRDAVRLLVQFAERRTGRSPSQLEVSDLDAALIGAFLDHLERERGNSVATRNARLAAIRSLLRFAELRHPEHAETIARALAIPPKRAADPLVSFLEEAEVDALLAAPDRSTSAGRRDRALLLVAAQTGLRISELTGLRIGDVHLGSGAHVSCHGKGRKERSTPLSRASAAGKDPGALLPGLERIVCEPAPDRRGRGVGDAALDHQAMKLSAGEARERDAVGLGQLAGDGLDCRDFLRGENGAGVRTALCPRGRPAAPRRSVFATDRLPRGSSQAGGRSRRWSAHRRRRGQSSPVAPACGEAYSRPRGARAPAAPRPSARSGCASSPASTTGLRPASSNSSPDH